MFSISCSFVKAWGNILILSANLALCFAAGCGSNIPSNGTVTNETQNSTEKTVRCLNERTVKSTIRWGEYNPETGVFRAYQCGGDLQLKKISRESFSEQYKEQPISNVKESGFCTILTETVKTFERLPTLNSQGPISRFIEYSPAPSKDSFRAVWNPRFRTFGSKDFRAIYDSLMVLVPQNEQW